MVETDRGNLSQVMDQLQQLSLDPNKNDPTEHPKREYNKTAVQLANQIDTTSQIIDTPIAPPSLQNDVLFMPIEQIKQNFPQRYEHYLKLLRASKRLERTTSSELNIHTATDISALDLSTDEREKMKTWVTLMNNLDSYIGNDQRLREEQMQLQEARKQIHAELPETTEKPIVAEPTLRPKQIEVFKELRRQLEQGHMAGYIKLPTGTGKTVLFTEFVEAANINTLIIVPSVDLIAQTNAQLSEFASGLDVGAYYGGQKTTGKKVTITTYDSLNKLNPADYGLVIADEAHRSLSNLRKDVMGRFDHALRIGFTATPEFHEEKKVSDILSEKFYDMSIRDAVEHDLLAPFKVHAVPTDLDISKVKTTETGGYDPKELKKVLEKAAYMKARHVQAKSILDRFPPGTGSIASCNSLHEANEFVKYMKSEGQKAAIIHGGLKKEERERIVKQYKAGEIDVLAGDQLIIEGLDLPRASVLLNFRPTLSRVVAEQRGGRVLRKDKNNPDKIAHIFEFLPTKFNPKYPPILFSDIMGEDFLPLQEFMKNKLAENNTGDSQQVPEVDLTGLDIVTDPYELFNFVKTMQKIQQEETEEVPIPEINVNTWQTMEEILKLFPVGADSFKKLSDKYRNEIKEWTDPTDENKPSRAARIRASNEQDTPTTDDIEYNPVLLKLVLRDEVQTTIAAMFKDKRTETIKNALNEIKSTVTPNQWYFLLSEFFTSRNALQSTDPEYTSLLNNTHLLKKLHDIFSSSPKTKEAPAPTKKKKTQTQKKKPAPPSVLPLKKK